MIDPLQRFATWFDEAAAHPGVGLHEAMTLSTVSDDGRPSSRIVLLKEHGPDGFVFYTNLGSRKARDLGDGGPAALLLWWDVMDRQVRIEGTVRFVSDARADAYFATRPRVSQVGAWASRQSETLNSRAELEARVREVEARYDGEEVPRPPFWSGYRLRPTRFEFWSRGEARLHHREVYDAAADAWSTSLLHP